MMRKAKAQQLLNELNIVIDLLEACLITCRATRRKLITQPKRTQKRSKP